MEIAQIIEKVKKNLIIQEGLKSQLEELAESSEITQEKISNLEDKIYNAETEEIELKESIIKELKKSSLMLKNNLELYSRNVFGDEDFKYGIKVCFMDKKRVLTDKDYELWSSSAKFNTEDFVEKMFNDYLTKGEIIFNKNSIEKITEFEKLYKIRPDVVKDKLISIEMSKYVKDLKYDLDDEKRKLAKSVDVLKKLNNEIKKLPTFKSEFLKKLFNKKSKLLKKREDTLLENKNLNSIVKDLERKISNKAELKEKANKHVQTELDALMGVIEWIDLFEVGKYKLANYRLEHIEVLNNELSDLYEKLARTKTDIKETNSMYKINKKVNNDIVENALMNKNIIEELNRMNFNKVSQENQNAVKFVENKYNEYLNGYIETLIK